MNPQLRDEAKVVFEAVFNTPAYEKDHVYINQEFYHGAIHFNSRDVIIGNTCMKPALHCDYNDKVMSVTISHLLDASVGRTVITFLLSSIFELLYKYRMLPFPINCGIIHDKLVTQVIRPELVTAWGDFSIREFRPCQANPSAYLADPVTIAKPKTINLLEVL